MNEVETSRIDFLARTAYRTLREWYPTHEGRGLPHWDLLTPQEKIAFREMALVVWQEVWTNSRPPMMPTPQRRRETRPGKVSAFSLLSGPLPPKEP